MLIVCAKAVSIGAVSCVAGGGSLAAAKFLHRGQYFGYGCAIGAPVGGAISLLVMDQERRSEGIKYSELKEQVQKEKKDEIERLMKIASGKSAPEWDVRMLPAQKRGDTYIKEQLIYSVPDPEEE